MRPDRLLACALWLAALQLGSAAAQTPGAPQTNQPPMISSGAAPSQLGNFPPRSPSPANNSTIPNSPNRSDQLQRDTLNSGTTWAGSDAAWTSNPAQPNNVVSGASNPVLPGNVIPASAESAPLNLRAQNAHNASLASAGSAPTSSPSTAQPHRPLKPPSSADATASAGKSTSTTQMLVSVISSLLIVLGLVVGAAWCYRKAAPGVQGSMPKMVVSVLGRTPIAPRQQLVLLRFGSKLILVSNLQGEVRTISEVTDPLEVDRLAGMCESAQPGSVSASFRTVLNNLGRAS